MIQGSKSYPRIGFKVRVDLKRRRADDGQKNFYSGAFRGGLSVQK